MPQTQKLHHEWDRFSMELSDMLSSPTLAVPTTRCMSKKTLSTIFSDIKKKLKLSSTFPSGPQILNILVAMGLAAELTIEGAKSNTPSKIFYFVGIGASHSTMIEPLEILQAYKTDGVICYFSALSYYGLTTQFPTHHHIATIVKAAKSKEQKNISRTVPSSASKSDSIKIGTLSFSYQGTPFYTTKRRLNTIPGIKTRIFNSKAHIKITSKEQTLLDTLNYSIHCGGEEVVLEAWDNCRDSIDEDYLLELLNSINATTLNRRLGTLLEFIDYHPGSELLHLLHETKKEVALSNNQMTIPFLKGLSYARFNKNWNTFTS